jgi:hypothetical protein
MMINRITIPPHTFANGITAALEKTRKNVRGRCEQIEVVINNNTGNATATVLIESDLGGTLYTKAGVPENATTVYQARPVGSTDADFTAFLCASDLTVTVTPSGDPGASGMTVDVYLYLDE